MYRSVQQISRLMVQTSRLIGTQGVLCMFSAGISRLLCQCSRLIFFPRVVAVGCLHSQSTGFCPETYISRLDAWISRLIDWVGFWNDVSRGFQLKGSTAGIGATSCMWLGLFLGVIKCLLG